MREPQLLAPRWPKQPPPHVWGIYTTFFRNLSQRVAVEKSAHAQAGVAQCPDSKKNCQGNFEWLQSTLPRKGTILVSLMYYTMGKNPSRAYYPSNLRPKIVRPSTAHPNPPPWPQRHLRCHNQPPFRFISPIYLLPQNRGRRYRKSMPHLPHVLVQARVI